MQVWVIESDGVPAPELFNSTQGLGTPIAIDKNTQIAYYYDSTLGVTPFGGSGGDGWTYLLLSSDYTVTSSTPVSVPGLSFTPEASSEYRVEGQLMVETDTLNNGASPGISWPSGLTRGVIRISAPASSTGEALYLGNTSSSGRAVPATSPASTLLPSEISATFLTGASPSGDFAITISSAT